MKVLIADDHAVLRRGLKQILVEDYRELSVGEAANSHEARRLLKEEEWDLVILDISMPGGGGLEVLSESKRLRPKLPVLVLTSHPEEQYALRVLKWGASGYLTKECAIESLREAVKKVLAGGKYISQSLAELLATSIEVDWQSPLHQKLSNREYEVMCLIASGKTPTEIAGELSLSVKTVSTHRARILLKMGMKNNAELTHYAIKNNLVF